MSEFIKKYWPEALYALLAATVGVCWRKATKKMKRVEASQECVQALVELHIAQLYEEYTRKQYLPLQVREVICKMFKSYSVLYDNGMVPGLVHELLTLPNEKPVRVNKRKNISS